MMHVLWTNCVPTSLSVAWDTGTEYEDNDKDTACLEENTIDSDSLLPMEDPHSAGNPKPLPHFTELVMTSASHILYPLPLNKR